MLQLVERKQGSEWVLPYGCLMLSLLHSSRRQVATRKKQGALSLGFLKSLNNIQPGRQGIQVLEKRVQGLNECLVATKLDHKISLPQSLIWEPQTLKALKINSSFRHLSKIWPDRSYVSEKSLTWIDERIFQGISQPPWMMVRRLAL